jgi:hypothetical protein
MKRFQCRVISTGEVINEWTSKTGGIDYREPSFERYGPFEVVEIEDHSERKEKLKLFRQVRDGLLSDVVDLEVKNIVLNDSTFTPAQVKKYRKALRDSTDPFKDWQTNPQAAAALDSLVVDEYVWPVIGE